MTWISSYLHLLRWVFIGLLFVTGCDSTEQDVRIDGGPRKFAAREAFSFEVAVAQQSRIRLVAINGNVEINGRSDARSVIITGERMVESGSLRDAEDHLDELEVQVRDFADEVFVLADGRQAQVSLSVVGTATTGALYLSLSAIGEHKSFSFNNGCGEAAFAPFTLFNLSCDNLNADAYLP